MSTAPSRTRSLRKPGELDNKNVSSVSSQLALSSETIRSLSPSRIPVKPPIRPPSSTGSSIRPPSQANISRPASQKPIRPNDPPKKDRSRPPITTTSKHLRNASTSTIPPPRASGHSRTKSSSTLTGSTTRATSRNEDPPRPPTAGELRKPFSTLQHHFSPAKSLAPKPHPAVFLAAPSPSKLPANVAISAETAKLQNELLQLHILHKDAPRVDKEWRASAERKLRAKFHAVMDKNDALNRLEAEERSKINAVALRSWQDTGLPGWGLEEKVQVLDEIITGLWNLEEPGGKYTKVVRRFEKWLSKVQGILTARKKALDDEEVVFLDELDNNWKDDCQALGRKLEKWREGLKGLGTPDSGSSLATVVEGCRSLVRSMLTELSVMAQIEKDALRTELDWIRSVNEESTDDDAVTAGAIWRVR